MGLRRTTQAPIALTLTGLLVAALIDAPAATAVQAYPLPSTGSITVLGHGLGHGHGMSQYGARGAAAAGLSTGQIVAFYYPGTTLATLAAGTQIRVQLSGGYPYPTVAATTGLSLRAASGALMPGVASPLPTAGISRYRLAPAGAGLTLQRLVAAGWANVPGASALPAQADFLSPQGYVWLYRADGSSTAYRDKVGAIRNGAGVMAINRVDLEHYTMGVVPREMPSSWAAAAVHAQAIAARTYAVYEMAHAAGRPYDICDTTQCQVYGGLRHYDSGSHLIYTDVPAVVSGTSYQVLRYAGQTIFSQFSASDGGWTVDGGQPYLVARADPYDNAASGDPYLNWTRTVPVSSIAANYGLAQVSKIEITARDGHGEWGGRVTAGYITGVDGAGHAKHIATTGFALQSAMGLPHNWFTIQAPVASVPGAPTAVRAAAADTGAVVTWGAPTSTGGVPITSYWLTFGLRTIRVAAWLRSAFVGPWNNGVPVRILVRAASTRGMGPAASVVVTPQAAPQFVTPLPAARLFDTRVSHTVVDSTHLFQFDFAGHGGVPATGAKAVQVAIEILRPTTSGVLMVRSWGSLTTPLSAISYRAGIVTTATVTIPLIPSTRVAFMPSAGTVPLSADVMSYSAASGQSLRSVAPEPVQTVPNVPLGQGVALPMRSVPGVTASTSAVVLSIVGSTSGEPGWLKVWADGAPAPTVNQVEVTVGGSNANTVIVPIGPSGAVRLASSTTVLGATVTLVGVLGPAAAGFGRLESFPPSAIADGTERFIASSTELVFSATGRGQLPAAGVTAVLLHLTVTPRAGSGSLWVYATGSTRPVTEAVQFGVNGPPQTTTVLVPVSSTGGITFVTTRHTAIVAVDAIGYITQN